MNTISWLQVIVNFVQAIISGVFVGFTVYLLDERRVKRERRLSDFRIASNWDKTKPRISLRNYDLTGANLSGHKFQKANLEDAILRNTHLWATDFSGANLRRADFSRAKLAGTKYNKAIAYIANFSKALISRRINPDREYIPDFSDALLIRAIFRGAKIEGAIFRNTNLKRTDFSGAVVKDCDFTGADLTLSSWRRVRRVDNCIWKGVEADNPSNFSDRLWDEIQRQNADQ